MKPAFLTITNQRCKSKRKPGDLIGNHRLIAPVGESHISAWWRYACGSCGAIHTIATNNMNNLRKATHCRSCNPRLLKNQPMKLESDGSAQV